MPRQIPDFALVVFQLESRRRVADADVNDLLILVVGGRRSDAKPERQRQEQAGLNVFESVIVRFPLANSSAQ